MLVLDKPAGITSMRAVEIVRRLAGGARTGHAGTLDPLATGVLVLALGRATRAIDALMAGPKRYETEIDLSATTPTLDAEGEPTPVQVLNPPSRAAVEEALQHFTGTFDQVPPAFSAVKTAGVRSYAVARRGELREPPPRSVTVHSLQLAWFEYPRVALLIRSEKGFYVRSLARDLGRALGTGGYCTAIRRTAVEPFTLADAVTLEALPERVEAQHLRPLPQELESRVRMPTKGDA